jgi:DNA-3-methyladenine glycosylase
MQSSFQASGHGQRWTALQSILLAPAASADRWPDSAVVAGATLLIDRTMAMASWCWSDSLTGPALPAGFFARETATVARELLGTLLVHLRPDGARVGRVVETEAYLGERDGGSHARFGPTRRNRPMYGPAGRAYVYLIYGMHSCLNVVTEAEGLPAAVLLRALEPVSGLVGSASGPGLLCRAMGIDRGCNEADLSAPPLFFVPGPRRVEASEISVGPRIGIDYAGEWSTRPLRFWLTESAAVSRRRAAGSGLGRAKD